MKAISGAESREARMVTLRRDDTRKPTIWCDPEITDLVGALNKGGVPTRASCYGHGYRPGSIILKDGRVLMIFDDFEQYQKAADVFPLGINGEDDGDER